jgi:iron complex transport system substrate-binding protein
MKSLKKSILFIIILCVAVNLTFAAGKKSKKTSSKDIRIVSLGPSATEVIFAIGAQDLLVARTDLCDYPPEAKNIPSVGGFAGNTLSLESIISYEPTLVYLFAEMHEVFVKPLQDLGIQVYRSNATSIEAVKNEVLDIGKLTGHEKQAQKVVKEMDEKISRTEKMYKAKAADGKLPTVYWEVWHSPMMSCGKNSFMGDIIAKAGGKNIFADEEQAYPMVSEEAVLLANPDFIFFSGDGMGGGKPSELLKAKGGIYYMGDDDSFVRSSPRCADAVEKLAAILWK